MPAWMCVMMWFGMGVPVQTRRSSRRITTCGACLSGFKLDGDACVDVMTILFEMGVPVQIRRPAL